MTTQPNKQVDSDVDQKSFFTKVKEYFSDLYFPAIGEYVIPILLYSGILQKHVKFEKSHNTRYRLNIILYWEAGFFKSSILKQVSPMFPSKARTVTSSSSAAIRGSFKDDKFFIPELLISDILVIPEFGQILAGDKEIVPTLLGASEEGDVRFAVVKGGNISDNEKKRIKEYGAKYEDGRLSYRSKSVIWIGTHTLSKISSFNKEALLSRFFMLEIKDKDIPLDAAWKNAKVNRNPEFEDELKSWLKKIYEEPSVPDHDFSDKVLEIVREKYVVSRKNPREVGDIRRIVLAHHEFFPNQPPEEVAHNIRKYCKSASYRKLSKKDTIHELILDNPISVIKIHEKTGISVSTIKSNLKRLKVKSMDSHPKKYYL